MKQKIAIISIILLLSVTSSLAFEKDSENEHNKKLKRWSVSAWLGRSFSGPAKEIEKVMVDIGLNDSSGGLLGLKSYNHPRSEIGITWMINGNYRLKQNFSVGVTISKSNIGTTHGYRDPTPLRINYSVTTFAPIISVQANIFRFGLGPALHIAKSDATSVIKNHNKFGFLIDFSFTIPENSWFFLEFRAQYKGIGNVEIGPYEITVVLKDPIIFPKTEVNYNDWSLGIGLGFRL